MSEEMKINVDRGEDYTKFTVTQPLFTRNEEIQLDNFLHDIVRDINNCYVHDKELAIMQEVTRRLEQENQQLKGNWKELKKYIEKEKDRLVKGVSHTYEDSLGKINYVNEDIYIKLVKVLNKMYELDKVKEWKR